MLFIAVAGLALGASAHAAIFIGNGYSENFDSMGTAGTTPPSGWTVRTGNSGTSNATWTNATGIPASGANSVATMIAAATPLTAITTPAAQNNNGFNAAASASTLSDRVLATSPTTVSGGALELLLTNSTIVDFTSLSLSYDIVRYNVASTANELPGYWLFYSLDAGTTWTNVPALNPTLAGPTGVIVPNTVGVTSVMNATVTFSTPLLAGANVLFRWVDDNATQTSPDQIIGLNNVSVTPTPGAASLLALGSLVSLRRRR
jgi:MYXO-CTERM domain-containing protein